MRSTARRAASCTARRSKAPAPRGARAYSALPGSRTGSGPLRALQRLERLCNDVGATIEFAHRFDVIPVLSAAFDIAEQIAQRPRPELEAYALQRVSSALRTPGIPTGDAVRECGAETRQTTFELADEFGKHVVASGGVLNEPDLGDEFAIEQHSCHLVPSP